MNLIIVAGATAVGKTSFCIQLAKSLQTEIISADSRQFYKEMAIGTAKPSLAEMQGVPHHFVDSHSIHQLLSAGAYEREASKLIKLLFQKHNNLILTGGSGLHIRAVAEGLDRMPQIPSQIREKLNQELDTEGLSKLLGELDHLDPEYAQEVDRNNPQRVIRALEVIRASQVPYSEWRKQKKKKRDFNIIKVMLDRPREELYQRINLRVNQMMHQGLLEEVKSLQDFQHLPVLQTVGYQELFAHFRGEMTLKEAIEKIKQNTRRFAKRQLTWFRKDKGFAWLSPEEPEKVYQYLREKIK